MLCKNCYEIFELPEKSHVEILQLKCTFYIKKINIYIINLTNLYETVLLIPYKIVVYVFK